MAGSSVEDRIRREFDVVLKEYAAFDRTLDALAALRFVLDRVKEIAEEIQTVDFLPKLDPVILDSGPYTPDGLIVLKHSADFVLELKTAWNENDIEQVIKYAKSPAYALRVGGKGAFKSAKCLLLGYQNTPGESNLDRLFNTWESSGLRCPLVTFRYSLEQAAASDRMFFCRVPYKRNGECPASNFGKVINSPRGISVTVDNYKTYRSRFHKTNDQVIASYAAILWWTKYASHYLSEEQKSEMAERGRLSSPLVLALNAIRVPNLPDVEVPLGARDIRSALDFLRQAKLVRLKSRAKVFEIELKEDRYIRLPPGGPAPQFGSQAEISFKILARWATHKIKSPMQTRPPAKRGARARRSQRDDRTLNLFE